jgi:hypothetical protein
LYLNVKLNVNQEESKYEGPPLLEPKTPYHIDYTPRTVNPELKFLKRLITKLTYIGEDSL